MYIVSIKDQWEPATYYTVATNNQREVELIEEAAAKVGLRVETKLSDSFSTTMEFIDQLVFEDPPER